MFNVLAGIANSGTRRFLARLDLISFFESHNFGQHITPMSPDKDFISATTTFARRSLKYGMDRRVVCTLLETAARLATNHQDYCDIASAMFDTTDPQDMSADIACEILARCAAFILPNNQNIIGDTASTNKPQKLYEPYNISTLFLMELLGHFESQKPELRSANALHLLAFSKTLEQMPLPQNRKFCDYYIAYQTKIMCALAQHNCINEAEIILNQTVLPLLNNVTQVNSLELSYDREESILIIYDANNTPHGASVDDNCTNHQRFGFSSVRDSVDKQMYLIEFYSFNELTPSGRRLAEERNNARVYELEFTLQKLFKSHSVTGAPGSAPK